MPSLDEKLGFSKIAKHYYFPGWHQQTSIAEFVVNLDRWNELDPADQELLETVCRDTIVRDMTLGEFQQTEALARIKADGVETHYWPNEILQGFHRAFQEVLEEQSAADADFKRVYDSYRTFRTNYAEWSRISRLPANFEALPALDR